MVLVNGDTVVLVNGGTVVLVVVVQWYSWWWYSGTCNTNKLQTGTNSNTQRGHTSRVVMSLD